MLGVSSSVAQQRRSSVASVGSYDSRNDTSSQGAYSFRATRYRQSTSSDTKIAGAQKPPIPGANSFNNSYTEAAARKIQVMADPNLSMEAVGGRKHGGNFGQEDFDDSINFNDGQASMA